jgi:hypothetical protein
MILVTILSAVSMSFETPVNRVVDQPLLQVNYLFLFFIYLENIGFLDRRIYICDLYEC